MRIVVVQPRPLASVGVVRWRLGLDPMLTVIVKAGFRFADADLCALRGEEGSSEPPPLSLDAPFAHPAAAEGELRYASDFAPRKPLVDILLSGHAYGAADRVDAELSIGAWTRRFVAVTTRRSGRIPLVAAHVREADGLAPARVGPAKVATSRPPLDRGTRERGVPTHVERYPEDFDFTAFGVAPAAQALPDLSLDAPIRLVHLSPRARERAVRLPALSPRVLVECSHGRTAEIDPPFDTLWIDTDREECVVVWRSAVGVDARQVERLVVSMEPSGDGRRAPSALRRAAPRGVLSLAAEPDRLSPEPVEDDERDELLAARCELLCAEHGVDPALTMEQYAAVAAALSHSGEPRADVLERHDLTEDAWLLEERAWLDRIAEAAGKGDTSIAEELARLTLAAQAKRPKPDETAEEVKP
jgi:hypothetical protein